MIDYLRREEEIEPGSEKIIIGNTIQRKIFEKIKMHPLEQQCLQNFKLILSQMPPLRLPNYWQDSDYLRVLAFHDYDIVKSAQVEKNRLFIRDQQCIQVGYIKLIYQFNQINYYLMEFCRAKLDISNYIILIMFFQNSQIIQQYVEILQLMKLLQMDLIEALDQQQLLIYKKHQKYYTLQLLNEKYKINKLWINLINRVIQILILLYTLSQFQQAFDFLLRLIIRDVLISYYIESIVIIIDINTHPLKLQNSFSNEFQNYIKSCQLNFYGRIHKVYILHEINQQIFHPLINVLKPEFQEKIIVLEKTNMIQLQKQIDPKYLEQKYLGFSQNLINNFWPPKNPTKSIENNFSQIQVDENQSKSNNILTIYKNESHQSSQFTLQVYNVENEMIFSETHKISQDNSFQNFSEYCPESMLFAENSVQISMECVLQELTSSQFSGIKEFSNIQNHQVSQRCSEQNVNTELQTYNVNIKHNCNMENCQLI